jgi:TorA maturation chaperone TorD
VSEVEAAIEAEDHTRAQIYRLLAGLLSKPADAVMLQVTGGLLGDRSKLGRALDVLAAASRAALPADAANEFQTLFIGLGRGELVPYGSYYLTGFLQEKPLARLRADLGSLGIERDEASSEPEDHIAAVLEAMGGLIDGAFGPVLTLAAQKRFFDQHIGSWAGHFFRDLEASPTSKLYAAVGAAGKAFLEVEEEAFRMI